MEQLLETIQQVPVCVEGDSLPFPVMMLWTRLLPVPDHDHPIELHNLFLEGEQLIAERGNACAGNLRHSFIARVGNNMQQFRDPFAADRGDNAELGEVSSDRIDHSRLQHDQARSRA